MTHILNSRAMSSRRRKTMVGTRARRKRSYQLESLEVRALLSYTFSYDSGTQTATATGTAAVDSLVIEPVTGFLEYSVNGSPFTGMWDGDSVAAAPSVTVDITLSTGDASSLTLGTATGPASDLLATFNVVAPSNMSDTTTIDDSYGTTLASGMHPYSINTANGSIAGPGIIYNESSSQPFGGGVTLEGSSPGNTDIYNVLSVLAGEPFNLVTGSSGTNTITVGDASLASGIAAPLAITSAGSTSTVTVDDSDDATNATATLDSLSGNSNAPYEVTGLSIGAIEYGTGVTTLTVDGGTSASGTAGVTFNINGTQSTTTTTLDGGPEQNVFDLSNPSLTSGLDNLHGPVIVNGGTGSTDTVTLDDSSANFNDTYTITGTTVARQRFGGLTYGDIGTLTLDAENTLGTLGNNIININDTADGIATNINGQGGDDTINVNSTGTSGTLNVSTGTEDGSTVNVVADNQPVNISLGGSGSGDSVNIGWNGSIGTMAGILGAIDIADDPESYALTFHDENDTTAQTWTLDNDTPQTPTSQATMSLGGMIAATTYYPHNLVPQ